jgi:hypothetical protein
MTVESEEQGMWKEAALVSFKAWRKHFLGVTERNLEFSYDRRWSDLGSNLKAPEYT